MPVGVEGANRTSVSPSSALTCSTGTSLATTKCLESNSRLPAHIRLVYNAVMVSSDDKLGDRSLRPRRFATTHWSLVLAAGRRQTPGSREALEALCRAYWYPLYAFLRRRGRAAEDSQDLVQEFFAYLLDKHTLDAADPERGRFRTFLLTVFQRFLAKQQERAAAQKRGGGVSVVSIDVSTAEDRYQREPFHELTPERIYERRWALTLLEKVLSQIEQEYAEKSKAELFDRLKIFLTGAVADASHAEIAAAIGLTPGAVKVAVHRLRQRYRELLRERIAETVAKPDEVEDELNHLLAALRT